MPCIMRKGGTPLQLEGEIRHFTTHYLRAQALPKDKSDNIVILWTEKIPWQFAKHPVYLTSELRV